MTPTFYLLQNLGPSCIKIKRNTPHKICLQPIFLPISSLLLMKTYSVFNSIYFCLLSGLDDPSNILMFWLYVASISKQKNYTYLFKGLRFTQTTDLSSNIAWSLNYAFDWPYLFKIDYFIFHHSATVIHCSALYKPHCNLL